MGEYVEYRVITRRLNHTASKTVDIAVYERRRRRRRTLEHVRCRAVSRAVLRFAE